jgi:phage gp36-like protein
MPFADLADINQHLPENSLAITDIIDDPWQTDAERIIRGYLSNVYSSATLASWTTPSNTPGLIRSIAGRLIAAWFYASKVAGEATEWNDYSDHKYKEAIGLLEQVQSGDLVLSEVSEVVTTGDSISSADFWPNDLEGSMFKIADEFA